MEDHGWFAEDENPADLQRLRHKELWITHRSNIRACLTVVYTLLAVCLYRLSPSHGRRISRIEVHPRCGQIQTINRSCNKEKS